MEEKKVGGGSGRQRAGGLRRGGGRNPRRGDPQCPGCLRSAGIAGAVSAPVHCARLYRRGTPAPQRRTAPPRLPAPATAGPAARASDRAVERVRRAGAPAVGGGPAPVRPLGLVLVQAQGPGPLLGSAVPPLRRGREGRRVPDGPPRATHSARAGRGATGVVQPATG